MAVWETASQLGQAVLYFGGGGHVGGRGVRPSEVWLGLVAMNGHSFGCLLLEVLWWLRTPQLVAGFTIPRVICGAQGPWKINMRRQGELTGSYSLRVLVISEWDSLRGARALRRLKSFLR